MRLLVKVGGAVVAGGLPPALAELAALRRQGHDLVVVHGGGPEISRWSERCGITPAFVSGLRYSDPETVAIAQMALARVGKSLALALTRAGVPSVSIGGSDAGLLTAAPIRLEGAEHLDLGMVGEVRHVEVGVLDRLAGAGLLPVVSTIAPGDGDALFNINADDAAADIAVAWGADALVLCTDVAGVLVPGGQGPLPRCDAATVADLIARGVIAGGMRPKVEACMRAVRGGVAAHIVDGRRPGVIAAALEGRPGSGTVFVAA